MLAYHRVDRIIRTEEHYVVGLYVGEGKFELVVWMVFVENVLGIILLIEES